MSDKNINIEKLKGSTNYHTWSFAMENVLIYKDFEKCIIADETKREKDVGKLKNAKALLSLNIDSSLYIHIQTCKTAYEIWKKLKDLFDDKGLSRKINLLRSLTQSRLESFACMQDYLNHIVDHCNKLNGIGFTISNDWSVAITLGGLTEKFHSMIMNIETSDTTIQFDSLIAKLLDYQEEGTSGEALFTKNKFNQNANKNQNANNNQNANKKKPKCKTCTKRHFGVCRQKEGTHTAKSAFDAFVAFHSEAKQNSEDDWYVDSGASAHMTPNAATLSETKSIKVNDISAANGDGMRVKSVGDTLLKVDDNNIVANNVLHVPTLSVNLLSVSKIVEHGNTVLFTRDGCIIKNQNGAVIAKCKAENGVYKLKAKTGSCLLTKRSESAYDWHRRLGHLNFDAMTKMKNGVVSGLNFGGDDTEIRNCETCARGKLARLPFKRSKSESKEILELIHSDIVGPMEVESIGRAKLLITFVDDFSRRVFVYFTRQKSDAFDIFRNFKAMIEKQSGHQIKILRSDNGGEYESNEFQKYLDKNGIVHQTSAAHTPQQNGRAERMNRTIIEKAKCLIFDAGLPKCYWAEAVSMAVYLINRTYTSIHGKTPLEKFTNEKVNISDLKLFGSSVMVHIPKANRRKLDEKATKMIFVGYDHETKGYRCINKSNRKLTISRDVKFLDHPKQPAQKYLDNFVIFDSEDEEADDAHDEFSTPNTSTSTSLESSNTSINSQSTSNASSTADLSSGNDTVVEDDNDNDNNENDSGESETQGEGDSTLDDDGSASPTNGSDPDFTTRANMNDGRRSIIRTRSHTGSVSNLNLNSHFALFVEPTTVSEALKSAESESCRAFKIQDYAIGTP